MNRIGAYLESVEDPRPVPLAEVLRATVERLKARAGEVAGPAPLPSSWPRLAEKLGGGLWPGLHLVAAAPGADGAQLVVQLALAAAGRGVPVLLVSDRDPAELAARFLAHQARTPWRSFAPPGGDLERRAFAIAQAERQYGAGLRELPLCVAPGEAGIRAGARELAETYGRRPLVVLDDHQARGEQGLDRAAGVRADALALALPAVLLVELDPVEAPALATLGKGDPARLGALVAPELRALADTLLVLVRERSWPEGKPVRHHVAVAKIPAGAPTWTSLYFDGATFWEPGNGGR